MHGSTLRGETLVGRGPYRGHGRFGRLFPELPSLSHSTPAPEVLGARGGPMDGGSAVPPGTDQDNPRIRAGYTFLGQFIDHDLTLDVTSSLEQQIDPDAVENFRTPALELDSLYGLGPALQPYLYDGKGRFLIDGHDLPRNSVGRALIGDPRNDENLIISQLHLLFLRFHNKVFDSQTDPDAPQDARFAEAQRLVRWHYQWMVVNEFLPRLIGTHTAAHIFANQPLSFEDRPFMPVEFSVAAYRFGHSQVRPGYGINRDFGAVLFPPPPGATSPPADLRGFQPVPPGLVVDWSLFFGAGAAPSMRIDTHLSPPLLHLPDGVVPPGTAAAQRSLAVRNLKRGFALQLPAGQAVAARLGIPALEAADVWRGVEGGQGPAPLWYYVLKEAEVRAQGHRLTGVGAQIVGQVFDALLRADSSSYLVQAPSWSPTLPGAVGGRFTMSDLVNWTLDMRITGEQLEALPGDDAPAKS